MGILGWTMFIECISSAKFEEAASEAKQYATPGGNSPVNYLEGNNTISFHYNEESIQHRFDGYPGNSFIIHRVLHKIGGEPRCAEYRSYDGPDDVDNEEPTPPSIMFMQCFVIFRVEGPDDVTLKVYFNLRIPRSHGFAVDADYMKAISGFNVLNLGNGPVEFIRWGVDFFLINENLNPSFYFFVAGCAKLVPSATMVELLQLHRNRHSESNSLSNEAVTLEELMRLALPTSLPSLVENVRTALGAQEGTPLAIESAFSIEEDAVRFLAGKIYLPSQCEKTSPAVWDLIHGTLYVDPNGSVTLESNPNNIPLIDVIASAATFKIYKEFDLNWFMFKMLESILKSQLDERINRSAVIAKIIAESNSGERWPKRICEDAEHTPDEGSFRSALETVKWGAYMPMHTVNSDHTLLALCEKMGELQPFLDAVTRNPNDMVKEQAKEVESAFNLFLGNFPPRQETTADAMSSKCKMLMLPGYSSPAHFGCYSDHC